MISRVLVTGASGFIGSWVVGKLAQQGVDVAALDLKPDDSLLRRVFGAAPADQVMWHAGSVAEMETVEAAISSFRPQSIVHLAALLIPACNRDPGLGASVNVTGHANVFAAAAQHSVEHVVYGSSAAAQRRNDEGNLITVYGSYKLWAEEFSKAWFGISGLPSIGLRPAIVYGYGRQAGETAFANEALQATLAGKHHRLPSRWLHKLEYIGDVAAAIAGCATLSDVPSAVVSDVSTTLTSDEDLADFLNAKTTGTITQASADAALRTSPGGDDTILRQLLPHWGLSPYEEALEQALEDIRRYAG